MTVDSSYQRYQLVLCHDNPDWGYGRIIKTPNTDDNASYWVYFYFTDQFVSLMATQLKPVPPNYKPPFAPDANLFFGA